MDHLITNLKNNLGVDPKKAVGVRPSTDAVTAITKTNTDFDDLQRVPEESCPSGQAVCLAHQHQ